MTDRRRSAVRRRRGGGGVRAGPLVGAGGHGRLPAGVVGAAGQRPHRHLQLHLRRDARRGAAHLEVPALHRRQRVRRQARPAAALRRPGPPLPRRRCLPKMGRRSELSFTFYSFLSLKSSTLAKPGKGLGKTK